VVTRVRSSLGKLILGMPAKAIRTLEPHEVELIRITPLDILNWQIGSENFHLIRKIWVDQ